MLWNLCYVESFCHMQISLRWSIRMHLNFAHMKAKLPAAWEVPPALCLLLAWTACPGFPCSPKSLVTNSSLMLSVFSLPHTVFIYNNDKKFSVCGFQTLWVKWEKKPTKNSLTQQSSHSFTGSFRPAVVFLWFIAILAFLLTSLSVKIPWFNTRKFVCVDKPALCFNVSYTYGILMNIAFSGPFVWSRICKMLLFL